MSAAEIVASLRARGVLLVPAPDGRIRFHPKDALSALERDDLARHRDAIRALLERDPVGWRAAVMATQVPAAGPVPLLVARPGQHAPPDACVSCGEPLGPESRYRCPPCVAAAVMVLAASP